MCSSDLHSPLFQVVFTMLGGTGESGPVTLGDAEIRPYGVDDGTTKFDLTLFMSERDGALTLTLRARSDLFAPATVRRALEHLRTTLCRAYHQDLPAGMQPTLVTTYRRTTFVSRTGEARLTCDSGLRCLDVNHEVRDTGTHVLVESKSGGQGGSAADRILRELGVRPASVSKYCVAVAALHPELPSNPWHQTLRRYFTPLQAAA